MLTKKTISVCNDHNSRKAVFSMTTKGNPVQNRSDKALIKILSRTWIKTEDFYFVSFISSRPPITCTKFKYFLIFEYPNIVQNIYIFGFSNIRQIFGKLKDTILQ